MKYIRRAVEDLVLRTDGTFKAVLVTGARQTGKTEMIKRLFPGRKYVSLDDPFIEEQACENPGMFMMLHQPPAVFDEVQRSPGLFRHVKIACDASGERGQFCLSGSQPLALMEKASESLAGRVGIIELMPLSQREMDGSAFSAPFLPSLEYVKARSATYASWPACMTSTTSGGSWWPLPREPARLSTTAILPMKSAKIRQR